MPEIKLGAIERPKDERDVQLGAVQAPIQIPASYIPDVASWLQRNYQGGTAFCGPHAGSHFKPILDFVKLPSLPKSRLTPRHGAIKLKDPKSPLYDGYGINDGTTLPAIFKWLQKAGGPDFEPLENDVTLPVTEYCDPSAVTPAIDANASMHKISSYAFGETDVESLCQAIYQNGAVILLIKCDDGFWRTATPTFTTPKYGHFVVAYGYDETGIYIVDSADPSIDFKKIEVQYITPTFIIESGTALDIPPPVSVPSLPAVPVDVAPTVQNVNILTHIVAIYQRILALIQGRTGSTSTSMTQKPWYASKTIWYNGLTILVAAFTVFGWTPNQQLFSGVTAFLASAAPAVNLVLRFLTKQPIALSVTDTQ